jgi:hypothetical protein
MAGLGQDLKINKEQYFINEALPQNTSKNSQAISTGTKGALGSFCVKAVVEDEVALADTKTLSITLQDSADGENFADVVTLYEMTADGAETIEAGQVLCEYVMAPAIRRWTRVAVVTDDAAATGSISAYPRYMPR